MLVEKEIISPGSYWYVDDRTGLPRKLDVTPELTHYWHEQGSKMLSAGLTVPVPYEHDFNSHPMTPKDKLLNNAGWVKEYRLKGDRLFGVVDVQDEEVARKLPRTIRWTSPWINSFTDGSGRQWKNVISHLALTTRPRITRQAPFGSVAAALSMATPLHLSPESVEERRDNGTNNTASDSTASNSTSSIAAGGLCISRAGRLVRRKRDNVLRPQYPIAFSLISGGIHLAENEDIKALTDDGDEDKEGKEKEETEDTPEVPSPTNPLADSTGDVSMEELLCDLLGALGVPMPENVSEAEFKRALYEATMSKIKELTGKAQTPTDLGAQKTNNTNNNTSTTSPAGNSGGNPLIQQEQQPMYMSLEEINKLPDPMKSVALSMYQENVKLRAEMDAAKKMTESLRDAKLKDAEAARSTRINLLGKLSPRVKADLEAMAAHPSMALAMGDGGTVIDPMAQTLSVLEKGLADMPKLLTTDRAAFSEVPQPTDSEMSEEATSAMADRFARMMGCPPDRKVG